MAEEKVVMYGSDEAATYKTGISGWVDRYGHCWGDDERMARYSGCTHRPCEECGEPVEKSWMKCPKCRQKADDGQFAAMPFKEWDGKAMLYSRRLDDFGTDPGYFLDAHPNEDLATEDLELIICEPQHAHLLDSGDFSDELPTNCDEIPDELQEAIDAFKEAVQKMEPLSWVPGKHRAIIKEAAADDT